MVLLELTLWRAAGLSVSSANRRWSERWLRVRHKGAPFHKQRTDIITDCVLPLEWYEMLPQIRVELTPKCTRKTSKQTCPCKMVFVSFFFFFFLSVTLCVCVWTGPPDFWIWAVNVCKCTAEMGPLWSWLSCPAHQRQSAVTDDYFIFLLMDKIQIDVLSINTL